MTTSRAAIATVVQGLSAQFGAQDAALVQQVVRDTRRRFDGHPTREFDRSWSRTRPGTGSG